MEFAGTCMGSIIDPSEFENFLDDDTFLQVGQAGRPFPTT
jgi:hypothetical protein